MASLSTGGAAGRAVMNTEVEVNRVGITNTINNPMHRLFYQGMELAIYHIGAQQKYLI